MVDVLGSLWLDVPRACGAVRFRIDTPEDEIRAAAQQEIEEVRAAGLIRPAAAREPHPTSELCRAGS